MKKKFIFPWKTKIVNEQGCRAIVYTDGSLHMEGYFSEKYEDEVWLGHRLSHHLNNEKIDRRPGYIESGKNKFILHSCDNKWCVENTHLRRGTPGDNIRDMVSRNENYRESRAFLSSPEMIDAKSKWMLGNTHLLGHRHSPETKAQIKANGGRINKPEGEEVLALIERNKNRIWTPEMRKKVGDSRMEDARKRKEAGCKNHKEYKEYLAEKEYAESGQWVSDLIKRSEVHQMLILHKLVEQSAPYKMETIE